MGGGGGLGERVFTVEYLLLFSLTLLYQGGEKSNVLQVVKEDVMCYLYDVLK